MFKRFRPSGLVGIDAGSHTIKVVDAQISSGSEFTIRGTGLAHTPPDAFVRGQVQDVAGLARAIREALANGQIKQRKAALAVPAQIGFVRRITFPPMPLKELRASIDLQPDRYIPFAREGAVYDLYPLPTEPDQKEMAVIVAAAPYQAVRQLMEAARLAGLTPTRIDLEPLTLFRAAVATGQASSDRSTGIVDVSGSSAKISLFEGDVPVISRVVDMPQVAPGEPNNATDDLFWDIRRSLEFALTQLHLPLARIVLTGGAGGDEYLALSLSAYLRGFLAHRLPADFMVEPLYDPHSRVPLSHLLALGLALPPEMFA